MLYDSFIDGHDIWLVRSRPLRGGVHILFIVIEAPAWWVHDIYLVLCCWLIDFGDSPTNEYFMPKNFKIFNYLLFKFFYYCIIIPNPIAGILGHDIFSVECGEMGFVFGRLRFWYVKFL